MAKIEYKIGETFKHERKRFKVVADESDQDDNCEKCALNTYDLCSSYACDYKERSDNTGVHFEEAEVYHGDSRRKIG